MQWKRTLQVIDVHCEGEVGRIVSGGAIDPPGDTMADKLNHINQFDDSVRRFLMREPRGFAASHGVLLTHPTVPEADLGLIILSTDKAYAMSGSNVMCAATALLETGAIEMTEPETIVTFDTAVGLVRAVATCRNGKCESVTLDMPPAFVLALDATVMTEKWGTIRFDVAFGGVFCAIVDVDQFGLAIGPDTACELAAIGVRLREEIDASIEARHPTIPEIQGVAYVMFRNGEADDATRTCSIMMPGRVDRSPCGTGSNANLATRHARGLIALGQEHVSRSVIGGEFAVKLVDLTRLGETPAIRARVTGRCWIHAITQLGVDPSDPFPNGFLLSDTWGPAAGTLNG